MPIAINRPIGIRTIPQIIAVPRSSAYLDTWNGTNEALTHIQILSQSPRRVRARYSCWRGGPPALFVVAEDKKHYTDADRLDDEHAESTEQKRRHLM